MRVSQTQPTTIEPGHRICFKVPLTTSLFCFFVQLGNMSPAFHYVQDVSCIISSPAAPTSCGAGRGGALTSLYESWAIVMRH